MFRHLGQSIPLTRAVFEEKFTENKYEKPIKHPPIKRAIIVFLLLTTKSRHILYWLNCTTLYCLSPSIFGCIISYICLTFAINRSWCVSFFYYFFYFLLRQLLHLPFSDSLGLSAGWLQPFSPASAIWCWHSAPLYLEFICGCTVIFRILCTFPRTWGNGSLAWTVLPPDAGSRARTECVWLE